MGPLCAALVAICAAGRGAVSDPYGIATDPGKIRSEAVDLLVEQLSDPQKGRSAARRLVRFGKSAVPALRRALASKDIRVRFYAASALSLIADPDATRIMLRVLADDEEHPMVRRIAAGAMSRAGCREAIAVLVRIARRAYPTGDAGKPGGSEGLPEHADAGSAPEQGDDPAAGAPGEPFRYEVVKALAFIGAADADDVVAAALKDPSPRIRKVAAQGLGDHRVKHAIEPLREALADPDPAVVAEAAKALAKFGRLAAPATEDLLGIVDHEDARVRRAVQGALTLATGVSFSTSDRWRKWWKRRQEEEAAEKPAEEGDAGTPTSAEDSAPVLGPKDAGEAPRPKPKRAGTGTPPALRMPWEWDDDDRTETPER